MWKRMLAKLRHVQTDDDLKQAARQQTEYLTAELDRIGIQVELATHRTNEELEEELRTSWRLPQ